MTITRAGLSFQVPWRRGSAGTGPRNADPAPDPALPLEPAATRGRSRSAPQRGSDGRFIRRSDAPVTDGRPAAPVATEPAGTEIGLHTDDPSGTHGPQVAGREQFMAALRLAEPGPVDDTLTAPRPIRIVLVEDVPDVAVHVRELLRSQPRFKLIQVISDGRRAVEEIRDLHPDVVLVDSLLQGRTSGRTVVEGLRAGGSSVGIVALTVPDHPVDTAMSKHTDAVVTLPLGTYDLGRGIIDAHVASTARDPSGRSRIVAIFSPKGGVGKTTIAYNLAVSLAETGLRTLLLDGSLQFGDVRRLLRADPTAPSICDLPTDSLRGSDLADTVVRDASGVEILLAPPRPELAELVNGHDLERLLGVLRRAYQAIVIDTPSNLSETTLAFLDAADLIIDVVTADAAAIDVSRVIADTLAEVGYPPAKVRYLVNRFDAVGALPVSQVARAIGRQPEYLLASDWHLVSSSNAEGVPFVLARPEAAASADLRRVAEDVRALAVTPLEAVPVRRTVWHR